MKKIIAAFKTHFDFGYTDLKQRVLDLYCGEITDKSMRICEETYRKGEKFAYKWTLSSYLLMQIYNASEGEKREKLTELIKRGQIVCHALPFTMHTPLLDEKLVQKMFVWTDEYCKTFNLPFPISAKMTDVPGHTSGIIEPLVKRGVKFLHLGKNPSWPAPNVPELFWWEDLKGNRILTMYNKDYGSSVLPPRDWKYPVWLAFCHTGDNMGCKDDEVVEKAQKQVGKRYDFSTGTMDDFTREIYKCDLSSVPVVRGELSDPWIYGVGSYPDAVATFRRCKEEFYKLEKIAEEKCVDLSKESENFYKTALVFTEHTFGINVLKYFGFNRVYEKVEFIKERAKKSAYSFAERSWEDEKDIANKLKEYISIAKCKLGILDDEKRKTKPVPVTSDDKYLYLDLNGKKAKLYYEYHVFGAEKVHSFMKKTLTRYLDWSISDMGKAYYPEIKGRSFLGKIINIVETENETIATLIPPKESIEIFGNFRSYKLHIYQTADGVGIKFEGKDKDVTNYVEAGNFVVDFGGDGKYFAVEQLGNEINVLTDVVSGSNRIMWAMDKYAKIDDVVLKSFDAPLVSFGKNAVAECPVINRKNEDSKFVINLFNNHWGTNFPQYIGGSYNFEFLLSR